MAVLDSLLTGSRNSGQRILEVVSLKLYDTGTYHDHRRRSLETNVTADNLESLKEALHRNTAGGRRLVPGSIANIAGNILKPTSRAGDVASIHNGWDKPRYRFTLEIMISNTRNGNARRKVLTGWTDYLGVDHSGYLDPNMIFRVNNNVEIRDMVNHSNTMGSYTTTDVSENNQVLVGSQERGARDTWRGLGAPTEYSLRPCDLMTTIGTRMTLGEGGFADMGYDQGDYDVTQMLNGMSGSGPSPYSSEPMEIINTDSNFSAGACNSRRTNLNASTYLSKLLGSLATATATASDYVDSEAFIYDTAAGALMETELDDSVLMQFKNLCEFRDTGEFTTAILLQLDPDLDAKTEVFHTGGVSKVFDHTNPLDTADWNGADMETLIAETITSSLTGILIDAKTAVVTINFTNMTPGSEPLLEVYVNYVSVEGIDAREAEEQIYSHFLLEVVPIITDNNQLYLNVNIDCDVYDETRIVVQIEQERPIEYAAFIAADATKSSVMTNDHQLLNNMASDVLNISSNTVALNGQSTSRRYTSSVKTY